MKKKILTICSLLAIVLSAQAHAWGVVLDDKGETLVGANVYWANTTVGTVTDTEGKFSLEPIEGNHILVTSYTGYHNDTTHVHGHEPLTIVLVSNIVLDEVNITQRRMAVLHSRTATIDTYTLSGDELCKAACCNLSEAFETNASVDVAYADAATGAKQIRLLGLSGTYVQLLSENTPGIRGLASNYGMSYIPGPWMESIQVSKGTSSVINGYEATTGQINVEYAKPASAPVASVNVMLNSELHAEANFVGGWEVSCPSKKPGAPAVSTALLAHYQQGFMEMDENGDGFLDMPVGQQGNVLNRWDIKQGDYTARILVRGLYDQKHGGQTTMNHTMFPIAVPNYGGQPDTYSIDLRTYRVEGYMKNGYLFDEETGMSIGVIAAASYHNQSNQYGLKDWQAAQTNAYLNAMFQTYFEDEHKLTAGLSINYDRYDETLDKNIETSDLLNFDREEVTPGIFAEYSYSLDEKLSLLLGLRGDYSTRYGFFVTPRMNVRYTPWEWWNIRGSVGLGYRSPNLFSDNVFIMPSSRNLKWRDANGVITNLTSLNMIGEELHQERALNAGLSTTFYIPFGAKELQLSGEYYYTHFFDGLIADMDADPHAVIFSNLNGGKSFAQSWQVEASMEVLHGWTITAAIRQTDVKQTTNGELQIKPLTNKYKGIITTSYQTPKKTWQFDFTAQFNGGGRMPTPEYLGVKDGIDTYSWNHNFKWYPQLMAQITKYWKTCSLYIGAENMTNYKQNNPIIGERDGNGRIMHPNTDPTFDASMTYGPITGWKLYVGFRWALDKPKHEHNHEHAHEHEHSEL